MQNRRLGKTGYAVSEIGLGTWQLGGDFGAVGDDTSTAILDTADRLGVNFWDTADVYGGGLSESRIGAHRKADSVLVATKVGRGSGLFPDHYSPDGVRRSIEGSLERLGVQTLDLVQLHCVPRPVLEDGKIFDWLDALKAEGLVRHYGASVETVDEGLLCMQHEGIATLQIIFNLFRQDAATRLLPVAADKNVGIIVRLPLASGLLSGKFGHDTKFAPEDHRNYNKDGKAFNVGETFSGLPYDKGVELAEDLKNRVGATAPLAQLALRWILDHPAVSTVIAGVSKPTQLEDNVAAAALAPLPEAMMGELADWYTRDVRPFVRGGI